MIEAVSQKDLDEVVKLRVKLFKESGKIKSKTEENEMIHYNKKYFEHLMEEDRFVGFIERNDQEIACIALAVILEFPPVYFENKGIYGHIFNVYTKEKYRNNGKAYNLLQVMIHELWKHSVDKIILDANENSVSLYEKLGFSTQDNAMFLLKPKN